MDEFMGFGENLPSNSPAVTPTPDHPMRMNSRPWEISPHPRCLALIWSLPLGGQHLHGGIR